MGGTSERSRAAEASRWFTVVTNPSITAEDLYAFREWRRDAANAAAFDEVKQTWEKTEALADRPAIRAATAAALAAHPPRSERPSRAPRLSLAPVAVGLASLAILTGGGLIAVRELRDPAYSTDVGGQRLEVLADGSRVRLNTDSKVVVDFGSETRRVRLVRGEAFFEVAHDAARPFVVAADGAEVRALGTKFDVRRNGDSVRVVLLEGRVQVRREGVVEARVLTPNQAVTVSAAGVSAPVAANAEVAAGWTTGRLTFTGAPLREAIGEVNRYSVRKIVLDAPASLAEARVSGQFVAGDTEAFVAGVQAVYGLRVVSRTDREIRLAPG
jgi:transmembrane sensor